MAGDKLHPSVSRFKEFVTNNPHIVKEVREGKATWQQLYEEWYLLGEEDPRWNGQSETGKTDAAEVKEDGGKSDLMKNLLNMAKKMDAAQLQGHLYNLSQALGAIQGLIGQFQSNPPPQEPQRETIPPQPFPYRKD
ncbi:YlbD family protein [Neobacillus sp. YIM B06451]|uniref:YlbD family protein n=1 Tax=Neobacillus sp. YIM B06451 TaxID=3070994 RepID=UPI002931A5FB|nr:YlbD family protein [Neobacillus sp. YIM B06451]